MCLAVSHGSAGNAGSEVESMQAWCRDPTSASGLLHPPGEAAPWSTLPGSTPLWGLDELAAALC